MADAPAPELVTVTVDGVAVRVPKGTNVLEAVRAAGGPISYFCYHPGLSVVAVCRQCLVDIKGQPKLAPACQALVAEGMEIANSGPKVDEARRAQLEFTLLNHPIDCPICDKAGECALQRQYQDHDAHGSRQDTVKIRKDKVVDVGPHIVLDQERCILCTRCVRVCDEVAKQPQLTMAWRGDHQVLTCAPGERLDNPYSLNTVDVCPVGALTSKDFRFKIRAWELFSTASVCPGCATGCNVEVQHKDNRAYRLLPRYNRDVNQWWMCDEGRFTYDAMTRDRVGDPRIEGVESTWDEALSYAAARIAACDGQVGVVLSAQATCEDNFVAARLALDVLGMGFAYGAGRPPGEGDAILRHADKNPNTRGMEILGRGKLRRIEQLGEDIERGDVQAVVSLDVNLPTRGSALAKLRLLAVLTPSEAPLCERAPVVLPATAWGEHDGTFVNAKGMAQRVRRAVAAPGEANPAWMTLGRLSEKLGTNLGYRSAHDVFKALREATQALHGAHWGEDLPAMQLRFAGMRG